MLYCLAFHARSHLISANFLWLYIDNYFRMTMCQPLFVVSLNKTDLILELLMWKWRQTTTKIQKEIDKYKNISDVLMRKIEGYVRKRQDCSQAVGHGYSLLWMLSSWEWICVAVCSHAPWCQVSVTTGISLWVCLMTWRLASPGQRT